MLSSFVSSFVNHHLRARQRHKNKEIAQKDRDTHVLQGWTKTTRESGASLENLQDIRKMKEENANSLREGKKMEENTP